MSKRIVFLISDTGGGHRASAQALVEALGRMAGDAVQCTVVDVLAAYARWPLRRAPGLYQPLVDHAPWLWRGLLRAGEAPGVWPAVTRLALAWQGAGLARLAADHPADLYVSIHPLLNHTPRAALRALHPEAAFATVVTDLDSAPPFWFDPQVDWLSASCPAVEAAALAAGLPAARVQVLGLPIRLGFAEAEPDRARARARLGMAARPTVLLLGGGSGIGHLDRLTAALAPRLAACGAQVGVICGHNQRLRARLAARRWPLPVHVLGYVEDMPAWMAAADLLITKAGPGTIAEALACRVPLLLHSFVPGQETGNIAYVEKNGVGRYCADPRRMAALAVEWLRPGNPALDGMRTRAAALARPRAAQTIAAALRAMIDSQ